MPSWLRPLRKGSVRISAISSRAIKGLMAGPGPRNTVARTKRRVAPKRAAMTPATGKPDVSSFRGPAGSGTRIARAIPDGVFNGTTTVTRPCPPPVPCASAEIIARSIGTVASMDTGITDPIRLAHGERGRPLVFAFGKGTWHLHDP